MKISILKSHLVFEISCRFENKTAGNLKYIVKSFQILFLTWMKDTLDLPNNRFIYLTTHGKIKCEYLFLFMNNDKELQPLIVIIVAQGVVFGPMFALFFAVIALGFTLFLFLTAFKRRSSPNIEK